MIREIGFGKMQTESVHKTFSSQYKHLSDHQRIKAILVIVVDMNKYHPTGTLPANLSLGESPPSEPLLRRTAKVYKFYLLLYIRTK